ncbi:MAG: 1-acyl-sn-glycerol-3-phosphate acyltransferase [Pseudomonadota bacterium]
MSEFDSIRPFHDHEVPGVVARVINHPDLPGAAAKFVLPGFLQDHVLGAWLTKRYLHYKASRLHSVYDCQMFTAIFLRKLIDATINELSVSGLEHLDNAHRYLFISNHRDIVMDSTLLNYLIHAAGHDTCRSAVGDNLLTNELAADLMRLNKSFVVQRAVSGAKATLKVLNTTSNYVRHSLEDQVSVWIAQRQGRAKDGFDRTDPTLLKMLALAYKDADDPLNALFSTSRIVPVSISYELDPCALRKAHELSVLAAEGQYDKSDEEDVQSIVMGVVGDKGRVHLHFGERITGPIDAPEEAAALIDQAIVSGMRVFPTHVHAAAELGLTEYADIQPAVQPVPEVMQKFAAQIAACPDAEKEFLLVQYANLLRNRGDLLHANGMQVESESVT